jgi:3-hydroxyacyl-[acyl-carrier-protein] dehydratase
LRYTNRNEQNQIVPSQVTKPKVIERNEIETLIPHRPPFLWIDRVEELERGVRCVAVKFVDPVNPIFAGHFPAKPILPGIFLIEAMAQTAGVMLGAAALQNTDKSPAVKSSEGVALLAAVNRFKFLKPVTPGQELRIETKKLTEVGQLVCISGTVWVGGEMVANGELSVVTNKPLAEDAGATA